MDVHRAFNFPKDLAIKPSSSKPEDSTEDGGESLWPTQDVEEYGIAGRIWEAAYDLGIYCRPPKNVEMDPACSLYANSNSKYSKTVIELGAGTGVAGLYAAQWMSPGDVVVLTDLEEVLPLLEKNVSRSEAGADKGAQVWTRALPWGHRESAEKILEEIHSSGRTLTHILCSDLVYFPELLAPLLRTMIYLTNDWRSVGTEVEVIISCRIRDLEKEIPFWMAFGAWFEFLPVLSRNRGSVGDEQGEDPSTWMRYGSESGTWIFIARRRQDTLARAAAVESEGFGDERLLSSFQDDTFELLLQLGIVL